MDLKSQQTNIQQLVRGRGNNGCVFGRGFQRPWPQAGTPSLGVSAGAWSLSWATTMENLSDPLSKLEELATNIWAFSIAFFHCLHRKTGSSQWIRGYLPGTWHMTGVSHKSPHEPPTVWEVGRPPSFYWWGNAGSARLHSLPALSHCGVAKPGLEATSKTSQPLLFFCLLHSLLS